MYLRRFRTPFSYSRRLFSNSSSNHDLANSILELNKEMESVFGEPPPSDISGSATSYNFSLEKTKPSFPNKEESPTISLTHINSSGKAQMVDVLPKQNTKRTAITTCKVILGKKVFDLVSSNQMAKGDVLSVAKIAGINGAKHTSTLIPLCHNIILNHIRIDLSLNHVDYSVDIEGEVQSDGKTGVEMEAMVGVSIAGLTVYDMCKAASKDIRITDVRLERKSGGKSGDWFREE